MRRWPVTTPGLLVAATLVGCGSAELDELPAAAAPAAAPASSVTPVGRVVPLGRSSAPEGVVVEPGSGRIAVGLGRPASLLLLEGETGAAVLGRVGLPGPVRHLALDGSDVLAPVGPAGRLIRIGARDGRVREDVPVAAGSHDAVAAAGVSVVVDPQGSSLQVVRDGRVARSVRVAAEPGGIVVTDDGRFAAVVSERERVVELYDVRTLRRVARVDAGVGPTHLTTFRNRLFVVDTAGDALLVFDLSPELELVRRVYVPGRPYGVALDPVRQRVWLTLTERNQLVELPSHGRPSVLRVLPTVRQPNSVAVDAASGRIVVAGRAAGELQLIPSQRAAPVPVPRPELPGP